MISCILLSAGLSSRFGSPKALVDFGGVTVIERLQRCLITANVDEVLIVLGAGAEDIKGSLLNHKKIRTVYNKDYKLGQTSSFQAGLREINKKSTGVFVLPVDFPLIKAETVDTLITYFENHAPRIVIPTFKGRKGHPPLFTAQLNEEFLNLPVSSGINTVWHKYKDDAVCLPVADDAIIKSFNTPEELKALLE